MSAHFGVAAGIITAVTPATGPVAGTNTLTISGSNLGSGSDITAVLLGNTAATVSAQTVSDVTVVAPAGTAGPVSVTVRSASRGTATLQNAYTYNARTLF